MKHMRNGFTLVEVMLFLAVSGLLLAGVLGMTQSSISSQRFNDATQSFAEFLRKVYSDAANPQSIGDGRSEKAVYGKAIVFDSDDSTRTQKIFTYDIIGNAFSAGGDAKNILKSASCEIGGTEGVKEEFISKWGSVIDGTTNGFPFKGTILVVRRSTSGLIDILVGENYTEPSGYSLSSDDVLNNFENKLVNFCVNMDGYGEQASLRWDVRLISNARNTSGIEIIDLDSKDNKCKN